MHGVDDNGPELARAVYGAGHFDRDHNHQTYYKPRYLRHVFNEAGKIYGLPKGVPGGWNE
jgi:hypothetical protein